MIRKMLGVLLVCCFIAFVACDKEVNTDPKGGTVVDQEGNIYRTLVIGSQVWMVDNLRTTTYNDGSQISKVTDNDVWSSSTTGAYCSYKNTENADSISTYGRLYNWYAVNTNKLAPKGWHVATDNDWKRLEISLGMSISDADKVSIYETVNTRGTNEGCKLAGNAGLWADGVLKQDADFSLSNFLALPGGIRADNGDYVTFSFHGYWWTSTSSSSTESYYRGVSHDTRYIDRTTGNMKYGASIRCVKD